MLINVISMQVTVNFDFERNPAYAANCVCAGIEFIVQFFVQNINVYEWMILNDSFIVIRRRPCLISSFFQSD